MRLCVTLHARAALPPVEPPLPHPTPRNGCLPLTHPTPTCLPACLQILRRESVRYDDQRGPVVLVVILLAVFLLAYVLAMVWIF